MAEPNEHKVRDLDPRSLRGLAHLLRMRVFAAHGFVEDAPERGKGRERWWKTVHHGIRLDDSVMRDWPEEWISASNLSDFKLRLTPEQTRELNDKLHELVESYRELAPPPDTPNAAQVRFHLHALPTKRDRKDTE